MDSRLNLKSIFLPLKFLKIDRWTGGDLNPRPPACKAGILPLNYQPIVWNANRVDFNCCLYVGKDFIDIILSIFYGITKIRGRFKERRQSS